MEHLPFSREKNAKISDTKRNLFMSRFPPFAHIGGTLKIMSTLCRICFIFILKSGVPILLSRQLHSRNFAPATSLPPLHSRTTSLPYNYRSRNFTLATSHPQLHSRHFTPAQLHFLTTIAPDNFTTAQVHSRYNFAWSCREWSCRSEVAGVKLSGVKCQWTSGLIVVF